MGGVTLLVYREKGGVVFVELKTFDARIPEGYAAFREAASRRRSGFPEDVLDAARDIVERVRRDGDRALCEFTRRFDNVALEPDAIEIPQATFEDVRATADEALVEALERAAARIYEFHARDLPDSFTYHDDLGNELGVRVVPVDRAGCYVPGGQAAYPSTVLMTVLPAKAAGVSEIVVCVPPDRSGSIHPATLLALAIARPDRVFRVGGAQAIAAMAYGTETIPACDVIVGPGNIYVAAAKKLVQGDVAIDMIAGPSEVAIVADDSVDPVWLALDAMAQAEHDPRAASYLITPFEEVAVNFRDALEAQLKDALRKDTIRASLESNGAIVLVSDLEQAIDVANLLAPEHLELAVADPEPLLRRVRSAGAVFLGALTAESFGDYVLGPNHTLPTQGTARFASPLSARAFLKEINVLSVSEAGLKTLYEPLARIAEAEGLLAHRDAARVRYEALSRGDAR